MTPRGITAAFVAALLMAGAPGVAPAGRQLELPEDFGTIEKYKADQLKEMLEEAGLKDTLDYFKDKEPTEWKEDWDNLTDEDKEYDEDYDPPGMPEVPLECADSSECAACFEPAYERLKSVRIRFEKLRRIYEWTKAYKERAFALGDSAAGIHGFAGLAWVGKRVELERTYKNFEATVEAKYEELLGELRGSLDQIAACEADVYGEEDWYNRFGFIFYQFMAAHYRPS